jgi:hypothetical protein
MAHFKKCRQIVLVRATHGRPREFFQKRALSYNETIMRKTSKHLSSKPKKPGGVEIYDTVRM